ncbi:MAG: stage III sporulation protein AC [Ruminococcaceae bacterium]|nr:stage III sporulation protein AC [Oscillospiraceae bacterium]MBQ6874068.1 stage III sporulation protein AC [Clostridia bacterium]
MEIDLIFKIAAIGLIVAILNQLLSKSNKDEYTVITTLTGLILVIMMILPELRNLFTQIRELFEI